jgi:hypothetical protein
VTTARQKDALYCQNCYEGYNAQNCPAYGCSINAFLVAWSKRELTTEKHLKFSMKKRSTMKVYVIFEYKAYDEPKFIRAVNSMKRAEMLVKKCRLTAARKNLKAEVNIYCRCKDQLSEHPDETRLVKDRDYSHEILRQYGIPLDVLLKSADVIRAYVSANSGKLAVAIANNPDNWSHQDWVIERRSTEDNFPYYLPFPWEE